MKKLLIVLTVFLGGYNVANAQNFSIGIKAGVQHNSKFIKESRGEDWNRAGFSGMGFHVGLTSLLKVCEQFSVQPQLLLHTKDVKSGSNVTDKMYTIDLPVNFLYTVNQFFIGAGPNFSYGISANRKLKNADNLNRESDLYEKNETTQLSELKRFELGANITMGYHLSKNIQVSANYTQGITNINGFKSDVVNRKTNITQASLSIAYLLK